MTLRYDVGLGACLLQFPGQLIGCASRRQGLNHEWGAEFKDSLCRLWLRRSKHAEYLGSGFRSISQIQETYLEVLVTSCARYHVSQWVEQEHNEEGQKQPF